MSYNPCSIRKNIHSTDGSNSRITNFLGVTSSNVNHIIIFTWAEANYRFSFLALILWFTKEDMNCNYPLCNSLHLHVYDSNCINWKRERKKICWTNYNYALMTYDARRIQCRYSLSSSKTADIYILTKNLPSVFFLLCVTQKKKVDNLWFST